MTTTRKLGLALVSLTLATACAEAAGDAATREDNLRPQCLEVCGSIACEGNVEVDPSTVETCADNCAAHVTPAAHASEACGLAYESLLGCLAASTCSELTSWGMDPSVSGICRDHADALADACPDFVFSFTDAP